MDMKIFIFFYERVYKKIYYCYNLFIQMKGERKMKIKKICIILLMIVLISSFATSCFAVTESTTTEQTTSETTKVEITKEKLEEKFQELQKYMGSDSDKEDSSKIEKIIVGDKTIEVTTDKDKYEINYQIGNKITFSIETEIKQGMSYEEYKRNTNNIDNVFYGYFAVANILGIKYEDAVMYCGLAKLSSISGTFDTSDSYVIYTPTPGVTLENPDDKTIISTEFGNRAMEYFNSVYKEDKYTYNDSEQYNTFECVVEKKEKTNTSCKLVETLAIDTDGDFSKISGISDSFLDNGVTKENADYVYNMKIGQKLKFETNEKIAGYESVGSGVELSENNTELVATKNGTIKGYITFGSTKKSFYITVEENTNNEQLEDIIIKIDSEESKTEDTKTPTTETTSKTETVKNNSDSTTAKTELPKTGINTIIYITMAIVGIAVVSFIILNKKYKDIK